MGMLPGYCVMRNERRPPDDDNGADYRMAGNRRSPPHAEFVSRGLAPLRLVGAPGYTSEETGMCVTSDGAAPPYRYTDDFRGTEDDCKVQCSTAPAFCFICRATSPRQASDHSLALCSEAKCGAHQCAPDAALHALAQAPGTAASRQHLPG